MDRKEREIIQRLDEILKRTEVRSFVEKVIKLTEKRLLEDPRAFIAYEPLPISIYGDKLPNVIKSSWVFILRAGANTGAERHPVSHQRMVSFRGSGDLQVWSGNRWISIHLTSILDAPLEKKWVSIPPNIWHRAIVSEENWVVVSFHAVFPEELVEERSDPEKVEMIQRERYLEKKERKKKRE